MNQESRSVLAEPRQSVVVATRLRPGLVTGAGAAPAKVQPARAGRAPWRPHPNRHSPGQETSFPIRRVAARILAFARGSSTVERHADAAATGGHQGVPGARNGACLAVGGRTRCLGRGQLRGPVGGEPLISRYRAGRSAGSCPSAAPPGPAPESGRPAGAGTAWHASRRARGRVRDSRWSVPARRSPSRGSGPAHAARSSGSASKATTSSSGSGRASPTA